MNIEQLATLLALPVDEVERRLRRIITVFNRYAAWRGTYPHPRPMRPGMVTWPTRRRRHRR